MLGRSWRAHHPCSLANVQVRLEELAANKQDADKALTMNDVNAAAARAVDHADRRADNIIKSIGGAHLALRSAAHVRALPSFVAVTSSGPLTLPPVLQPWRSGWRRWTRPRLRWRTWC